MEHQRLQAERNRLHGTWLSRRLTYLRWLFFTCTKDFKTWVVAGCIHLTLKLPEDMKRRSEFQVQRTADFNEVFVWNEKRCNAKAISKLRTAHETELKQTKVRQDNQDRDIEMAPLPLMLCKKYAKSQSRFISFHAFSVFVVTRGSRMEQDQSQQHKMEWEGRHQVQYLVYQCVLWYLCYCLRFLHNPCHFHFLWKQVQILCDLCNCGSLFYKNLKGSELSLEEPNKKRKMNAERKIVHKPTGSQLLDNLLWAQSGSNSSLACVDSKHFVATSRCISWLSEEVLQLQVQSIQAQRPMFWRRKVVLSVRSQRSPLRASLGATATWDHWKTHKPGEYLGALSALRVVTNFSKWTQPFWPFRFLHLQGFEACNLRMSSWHLISTPSSDSLTISECESTWSYPKSFWRPKWFLGFVRMPVLARKLKQEKEEAEKDLREAFNIQ